MGHQVPKLSYGEINYLEVYGIKPENKKRDGKMEKDRTVPYADVLKEDFYCHCGAWVYCPEMNGTKLDEEQNEVACIGEGCTKRDDNGEYMECPECAAIYYLT